MVPLALGACHDFYLVVEKGTRSVPIAAASGLMMFLVFMGARFGCMGRLRARRRKSARLSPTGSPTG